MKTIQKLPVNYNDRDLSNLIKALTGFSLKGKTPKLQVEKKQKEQDQGK